MAKIISVTLLLMLQLLKLSAQENKLAALYQSREYEKCLKKALITGEKDPMASYAHYYAAISLFEMEQLPNRYTQITSQPIEDCLKALIRLSKSDPDKEYSSEHADTIKIIQDYAEELAKSLIDSYKSRSIRIYKQLAKAFSDSYSPLRIVEIYFQTDDYDNGFKAIERMFVSNKADVSPASVGQLNYEALIKSPLLLIKYSMFNNAYYIIEQNLTKYKDNAGVTQAFLATAYTTLEKLAPAKDKNLFFSYTDRSLRVFGENAEFKTHLFKLYMNMLNESEKKFAAVTQPATWRDSVPLIDFYQYASICYSIFPVTEIKDRERQVTAKYRMEPEYMPGKPFHTAANGALHQMRTNPCRCIGGGEYPGQDTLLFSLDLTLMALEKAQDMYAFNYTDTLDRKGRTTLERVKDTGLKPVKYNSFNGVVFYGAVEVNECVALSIPLGTATTEDEYRVLLDDVFNRWQKSKSGDCQKILTPQFTHYGMAGFGNRYVLVMAKILDISDK